VHGEGSVQSQPLENEAGNNRPFHADRMRRRAWRTTGQSAPQPNQGVAAAAWRQNPAQGERGTSQTKSAQTPARCSRREVVPRPRRRKIRQPKASLSELDKSKGARITHFDEDVGENVQFGALGVRTDA